MSRDGALLAARFSYMPNRLGYCGPEENRALLDYLVAQDSDRGLEQILANFAGAFPYYSFIAAATGIADPLDVRVIEAYWIGNELLERVEAADLYRHLAERFERRFSPTVIQLVLGQVPAGARPHHNFHVFSMPIRTGHLEIPHSLQTMDECRISWGRIIADHGDTLLVERRPLQLDGSELILGPAVPRSVLRRFNGKMFLPAITPGDLVAMHWGCACHVLAPRQVRFLAHYTNQHLALANRQRHALGSAWPRGAVLLEA